jgi:hypothetical protein
MIVFKGDHKKLEQIKNTYKNLLNQDISQKLSNNKFKIIKHLKLEEKKTTVI